MINISSDVYGLCIDMVFRCLGLKSKLSFQGLRSKTEQTEKQLFFMLVTT